MLVLDLTFGFRFFKTINEFIINMFILRIVNTKSRHYATVGLHRKIKSVGPKNLVRCPKKTHGF
jgi:hypothetical protein